MFFTREPGSYLPESSIECEEIRRQVLEQGEEGVIHKNRYHKPINTYEETIRKELAHIYRVEFRGTNFTEFAKIMNERGYDLSRSTIYNILREQHIRSPQRKKKKRKKVTPEKPEKTTKTANNKKKIRPSSNFGPKMSANIPRHNATTHINAYNNGIVCILILLLCFSLLDLLVLI